MTQCPHCHATLGANAKFCSGCGKPVSGLSFSSNNLNKFRPAQLNDTSTLSTKVQSKIKNEHPLRENINRPNALSLEAIRHTLFVMPEHFSNALHEILELFAVEAAGVICSANGSCVVDRCQQVIREAKTDDIQYVCIIGNWHDVPPLNIPNDFGLNDGDDFCQSDAFFGASEPFNSDDPFTAIPDLPVGRIPVADRDIVQRVLGSDPEISRSNNSFQFGVTAQCWEAASKEIVSSLPNLDANAPHEILPEDVGTLPKSALISSPQWTELDFRRVAGAGPIDPFGLIYFNVHGGADEPQWVGEGEEGGYVQIFEPGTVVDFNSAFLVSEACYGGALSYDSPSIVEHFFTNGGHSFVGSSTIAYGASSTPISAADLIAKHYLLGLYKGLTNGEALKLAKMEALSDDPLTLEYGFKTALSFNLFGAPWQTFIRASSPNISSTSVYSRPTSGSLLNRVRSNMQSSTLDPGTTINKIRDEYRARLPPRNRQFMVQSSDLLQKLREFKDFPLIMEKVSKCGARLDELKLDFVSAGNTLGFRLICPVHQSKRSKSMLILIADGSGRLTKTLVTKGTI